jgi:hypothetical protein
MKMIDTFLAGLWRKKEHACLVDNRGHGRAATLSLRGYVHSVEGPAK